MIRSATYNIIKSARPKAFRPNVEFNKMEWGKP